MKPVNSPTLASKCSNKRKGHMSLILNKNLEMRLNLVRKACPKPRQTQTRPPVTVSQAVNAKGKFLKEVNSSEHANDKKVKQPHHRSGESFSVLDRRSNQPQHCLK